MIKLLETPEETTTKMLPYMTGLDFRPSEEINVIVIVMWRLS